MIISCWYYDAVEPWSHLWTKFSCVESIGKMHVSTVTTFAETIFRECIFAAIGEILKTQLQTRAHRCSFVPTHLLRFGISQMKESQSTDNMLKTLTLLI